MHFRIKDFDFAHVYPPHVQLCLAVYSAAAEWYIFILTPLDILSRQNILLQQNKHLKSRNSN